MYNILELSAKTLDQLKVIAAEMGIQKIDGIEQEDLVYKILDQQAIDMASKAAANPPAPKKRGPKPKKNKEKSVLEKPNELESKSNTEPTPSPSVESTGVEDTKEVKKKGRKKKSDVTSETSKKEDAKQDNVTEVKDIPSIIEETGLSSHPALKEPVAELFENLKESEWHGAQSEIVWRFSNCNTALSSYMWDYLHAEELGIDKDKIAPPIDMVFQQCDLGSCDESIMTFWTMRIIIDACHAIKNPQSEDIFDEALIQTQEMYYYTLAVLCQTYATGGEKSE